jgi:integrase
MPRPATGRVVERERDRGTVYGLRFRADGKRQYMTLGSREDGWTRQRAETELANVLADVRRGIWKPPAPQCSSPRTRADDASFHAFASE